MKLAWHQSETSGLTKMDALNLNSTPKSFAEDLAKDSSMRDAKQTIETVSNLSTSNEELMSIAQDIFTNGSAADQQVFTLAMQTRTRIETAISNLLRMMSDAANTVIRNMRL